MARPGKRGWRGGERRKGEEHGAEKEGRGTVLRAMEVEGKMGEGRRVGGKERK